VVPHLWARWRRRLGGGRNKVEVNVALLVNLLGQFPSMPFDCFFYFYFYKTLCSWAWSDRFVMEGGTSGRFLSLPSAEVQFLQLVFGIYCLDSWALTRLDEWIGPWVGVIGEFGQSKRWDIRHSKVARGNHQTLWTRAMVSY